jgi:hypothetical protein
MYFQVGSAGTRPFTFQVATLVVSTPSRVVPLSLL